MKTTREAHCHFLFFLLSESIKNCNCKISNSMSDDGPENHRVPHSLFFCSTGPARALRNNGGFSLIIIAVLVPQQYNAREKEESRQLLLLFFFFHFFSFFLMGYKGPFLVESPKFAANPPFFSCYFSSDPIRTLRATHPTRYRQTVYSHIRSECDLCSLSRYLIILCVFPSSVGNSSSSFLKKAKNIRRRTKKKGF